jgi:SulP family sulfate permease
MHFILSGRVGILVAPPNGDVIRVRSLGALTTVGELGLITGQPRTASIEAEVDTQLYEFDAAAFATVCATHPALAQALLTYIICVLGERLAFANRAIGVLRR